MLSLNTWFSPICCWFLHLSIIYFNSLSSKEGWNEVLRSYSNHGNRYEVDYGTLSDSGV